jgi:hypothetical protein
MPAAVKKMTDLYNRNFPHLIIFIDNLVAIIFGCVKFNMAAPLIKYSKEER